MSDFGSYLKDRNAHVFSGEPLLLQCGYYNCFLQKSIEETKGDIDVHSILINSAHEIVYAQFAQYFDTDEKLSESDKKALVEEYYSYCGFGKLSLRGVTSKGGHVDTAYDHYAISWKDKFGLRNEDELGVSFFTLGFLCGAVEAIYNIPLGTFSGKQTKCLTKGDKVCRFEVFRGLKKSLHPSIGEGVFQRFEGLSSPSETSIDYDSVRETFIQLPLTPNPDSGLIEVFGTNLTRHYANYYCLVSIRILIELEKRHGKQGILKAKSLMKEAGQACALNIIGGIMSSTEWETQVGSVIKNQDDWVYAAFAYLNALGWGKWEVEVLNAEGDSVFTVVSGFESNSYLKMVGKAKEPICYFSEGIISGIMNMVYVGEITKKPELDEEFYKATFNADDKFDVVEAVTRMMGASEDKFTVRKSS